jgi:hypothetical protein
MENDVSNEGEAKVAGHKVDDKGNRNSHGKEVKKATEIHVYLTARSKAHAVVDIEIHDEESNETTIIFVGADDDVTELAQLYLQSAGLSNDYLVSTRVRCQLMDDLFALLLYRIKCASK